MDAEKLPQEQGRVELQRMTEILGSLDSEYQIEVMDNPESPTIQAVAQLDAELFGEHKSLSAEDFSQLVRSGGYVYAHRNGEAVISEASLVLNADLGAESPLERALPSWLGYCDGAAVAKDYRGKGLQKELLLARELTAKELDKEAVSASVRHRNLPSIKSMLRSGYVMVADASGYYGKEPEDDRVVMMKDFSLQNELETLRTDNDSLEDPLQGITSLDQIDDKISDMTPIIALGVENGDDVDSDYNAGLKKLLRSGYVGVSCHDLDVGDSDGEPANAMVFVRIDSMGGAAGIMQSRQKELQEILDTA